ncbi:MULTISPECIES: hypothetical protein [Streptomyces]|uniref:Uncharacterized protein n=1 Tax=Streptomyces solicathayae TaxID=3081768 RepID=A0ABZ0M1F2_9ACTN|nr:hypothetical protein [Streptomyces sp. HUAS YS2]WOX25598.1 hypothetical protein R2D22_31165 [Streptomyces sp. HUAS YS2]
MRTTRSTKPTKAGKPGRGKNKRPSAPASLRRTLRRETARTVGLLVDTEDFATMGSRYPGFAFDDHPAYLHQVESLLKALAAEGGHTTVGLFDPEEYADYCTDTGLDPDSPASRSRYTAEMIATGARVAYTGQPMSELVPILVDTAVRQATQEYAGLLLADAGECAECGKHIGRAAYTRAVLLLQRLLEAAGPGTHHLVCSIPAADETLLAVLHTETRAAQPVPLAAGGPGAEFVTVLAAGIALQGPGGLVLRTLRPGARDRLHGWRLDHGSLQPLTEAEVFNAYCTDAETGEPLAPEPHVDYRAGFDVSPETPWPDHH